MFLRSPQALPTENGQAVILGDSSRARAIALPQAATHTRQFFAFAHCPASKKTKRRVLFCTFNFMHALVTPARSPKGVYCIPHCMQVVIGSVLAHKTRSKRNIEGDTPIMTRATTATAIPNPKSHVHHSQSSFQHLRQFRKTTAPIICRFLPSRYEETPRGCRLGY